MKEYRHIVDLIEDGYQFRRNVDDMRLYRKDNQVMLAKVKANGELEILIHSTLILEDGKSPDKKC